MTRPVRYSRRKWLIIRGKMTNQCQEIQKTHWSDWSQWSDCNCDSSVQVRTSTCTLVRTRGCLYRETNYVKGTNGVIGLTVESCGNGIRNQTQSCECETPPPPPIAPPVGPLVELKPPTNGKVYDVLILYALCNFKDVEST